MATFAEVMEADRLLADVIGPDLTAPPLLMGVDVRRLRQSLATLDGTFY